jgi:hypothetical protein
MIGKRSDSRSSRLQYWNAIGTYLERNQHTQNGCNLLITEILNWWRRGSRNMQGYGKHVTY